jgi:hypothetical protein
VYVDCDDILSETARGFTRVLREKFGKRVAFEEIFSFDLGRSFGLSPEDTAELMRQMHEPRVLLALAPVPGAAAGLRRWRRAGCGVFVITGRPPATRAVTAAWLRAHDMEHDRLIFVDKYARGHAAHASADVLTLSELRDLPLCLAVEDSPVMIRYVTHEMRVPLAILDRPWNRDEPEREGLRSVVRCRSWRELVERFPCPGAAFQAGL